MRHLDGNACGYCLVPFLEAVATHIQLSYVFSPRVPRPSDVLSKRGSIERPAENGVIPTPPRKYQDSRGSPPREHQSPPRSPPGTRQSPSRNPKKSPSPVKRGDSDHSPTGQAPAASAYVADVETSTEDPDDLGPTYQNTRTAIQQYQNTILSGGGGSESGQNPPHSPLVSQSRQQQARPSAPDSSGDDYDDIRGESEQTEVQTEAHRSHSATPSSPPLLPSFPKYVPVNGDDYVDLDADNTYINPQELRHSTCSSSTSASSVTSPPPAAILAAMNKPLPSKL